MRAAAKSIQTPDAAARRHAREAGLRYVGDDAPGIRRTAAKRGFDYLRPDGSLVRDEATLRRIQALAVPPAWTEVWICADERGHLQATGRDARGRKQYRYHARWREQRDDVKYDRIVAFARALPRIRRRVARDLARPGVPREKVLAAVVSLLESTHIRIGNDEYARSNGSFGLTTLRDRHARVRGEEVTFRFRAKSGRISEVRLRDRRLARIVARCRDLPGQELFQYLDDDGRVQDVGSDDVNAYLREATGEAFTAKDFRTWSGTVLAAMALCACEGAGSVTAGKRNVRRAIEAVAARLGNTVAVCRKSYVHPSVVHAYLDGALHEEHRGSSRAGPPVRGLAAHERLVLRLLVKGVESRPHKPDRRPVRQGGPLRAAA